MTCHACKRSFALQGCADCCQPSAGHTLEYPLQYLRKHLGKFSDRVRLQQVGGQKSREATPVSSPASEQFNIVARAIYETVHPKQVPLVLFLYFFVPVFAWL